MYEFKNNKGGTNVIRKAPQYSYLANKCNKDPTFADDIFINAENAYENYTTVAITSQTSVKIKFEDEHVESESRDRCR